MTLQGTGTQRQVCFPISLPVPPRSHSARGFGEHSLNFVHAKDGADELVLTDRIALSDPMASQCPSGGWSPRPGGGRRPGL